MALADAATFFRNAANAASAGRRPLAKDCQLVGRILDHPCIAALNGFASRGEE